MSQPPEIVFRSTLRRFWPLAVAGLGTAALLGRQAHYCLTIPSDPWTRFLCGYLPLAWMLVILVGMSGLALRTAGHEVRISRRRLYYRQYGRCFSVNWDRVRYVRPAAGRRRCLVGDGRSLVTLDRDCFKEFDQLVRMLELALEQDRTLPRAGHLRRG